MAIEEVLLIGGPAGVGKTSVGWEVAVQLNRLEIGHWHLEGDVLDAAWPRPADDQDGLRMTVNTLRAMAAVFAGEGYKRCVYVQTASVIGSHLVTKALGEVHMAGVLLTASEATRFQRLSSREIGSDLDRHLVSTRRMAERLEHESPEWVIRIPTDDRTVAAIAKDVIGAIRLGVKARSTPPRGCVYPPAVGVIGNARSCLMCGAYRRRIAAAGRSHRSRLRP